MKPEYNQFAPYTPYIIFTFGLILSLTGFFIKMAISRMEKVFDKSLLVLEKQAEQITQITIIQNIHEHKIAHHSEVLRELRLERSRKGGKIEEASL